MEEEKRNGARRKEDAEKLMLLIRLDERVFSLQAAVTKMEKKLACDIHEGRITLLEGVMKVIGLMVVGLIGKMVYSTIVGA